MAISPTINNTIDAYGSRHEKVLQAVLNNALIPAPRMREAISYSLFPGGKRLRPILVYLCGDLIGVSLESLDMIAAAIELTHCYSLVHDDLPAMDNDDLRRGKPSCHRAFDEATAILVGDSLQALAIDILLGHLTHSLSPSQVINVTHELVRASGAAGMVSGQSLDLSELANPSITEAQLRDIHLLKTGQLILACINMVLAAGQPTPEASNALRQFAHHLGLAFQMQDDYLDMYDKDDRLGKGRSADTANQKTTFATLYSQPELSKLIAQHFQCAEEELSLFEDHADNLCHFIQMLYYSRS